MKLYDLFWTFATSVVAKLAEQFASLCGERLMKPGELDSLMTERDVCKLLQIHRVTLLRLRTNDSRFPRPVKIGTRLIRWKKNDLQKWLSQQK